MIETKVIPTSTITTSNSSSVTIYTFYNRNEFNCNGEDGWTPLPYIKEATITESIGYKNGVPFLEGELLISAENSPSLVDYWIDSIGNLIIKGDDANSYYIDSNGDLIYDLCGTDCDPDAYFDCGYIDDDYVE